MPHYLKDLISDKAIKEHYNNIVKQDRKMTS